MSKYTVYFSVSATEEDNGTRWTHTSTEHHVEIGTLSDLAALMILLDGHIGETVTKMVNILSQWGLTTTQMTPAVDIPDAPVPDLRIVPLSDLAAEMNRRLNREEWMSD